MPSILNLPVGEQDELANGPEDDGQLALFAQPGPLPESAVPHLIIQLQDDLARSRRREAIWLSIITHLVIILGVIFGPKLPFFARPVRVLTPSETISQHDLRFLELPPDLQKPVPAPHTNILSDKNRVATSRTPQPSRDELNRILDARKPGQPGRNATPPPAAQPATQPAQQAQGAPAQGAQQPAPPQAHAANNNPSPAQPTAPPQGAAQAAPNPFNLGHSSASEAAAATAPGRGTFGDGGELGAGYRGKASIRSDAEVLSDTMGVDFGPYLTRVVDTVRRNWYNLMPESANRPFFTKGKVSITFRILKGGQVADMMVETPSGRLDLDRAAMGGITLSNPFPPLPREFAGSELRLRFHFFYNPDRNEIPAN